MSIESQLQEAVPTTLPTLDHDRLQHTGRRRRSIHRAGKALAAMALLAGGAVVGLNTVGSPGGLEVAGTPGGPTTDQTTSTDTGVVSEVNEQAQRLGRALPDPNVVRVWSGSQLHDGIDRLRAALPADTSPATSNERLQVISGPHGADAAPDTWEALTKVVQAVDGRQVAATWQQAAFEPGATTPAVRQLLAGIPPGSASKVPEAAGYQVDDQLERTTGGFEADTAITQAEDLLDDGDNIQALARLADSLTGLASHDGRWQRTLDLLAQAVDPAAVWTTRTDLLDRTVVAIRTSTDEGEVIELFFDPEGGIPVGFEVRLAIDDTGAQGTSHFRTEAVVLR